MVEGCGDLSDVGAVGAADAAGGQSEWQEVMAMVKSKERWAELRVLLTQTQMGVVLSETRWISQAIRVEKRIAEASTPDGRVPTYWSETQQIARLRAAALERTLIAAMIETAEAILDRDSDNG